MKRAEPVQRLNSVMKRKIVGDGKVNQISRVNESGFRRGLRCDLARFLTGPDSRLQELL